MRPRFRITVVTDLNQLEPAWAVRHAVFVVEQSIPEALERDGRDADALHALVWDDNVPVATGRVLPSADGCAVAARIAVLPAYRGRGLGKLVVGELERLARTRGATRIALQPHRHLEAFYEKLGYRKTTDGPIVGDHPLICMEKPLAGGD